MRMSFSLNLSEREKLKVIAQRLKTVNVFNQTRYAENDQLRQRQHRSGARNHGNARE